MTKQGWKYSLLSLIAITLFKAYAIFLVFRVGYNIKKAITEENFYKDRESQVNAIEKTFAKAKEKVTHVCQDLCYCLP